MRNAHDLGYHTDVIYDASAGYTRKQQDDFVAEIAPFYANAITAPGVRGAGIIHRWTRLRHGAGLPSAVDTG